MGQDLDSDTRGDDSSCLHCGEGERFLVRNLWRFIQSACGEIASAKDWSSMDAPTPSLGLHFLKIAAENLTIWFFFFFF